MADILIANEIMAEMVDNSKEYKQYKDYLNNPTKHKVEQENNSYEHDEYEEEHDER